MTASVVVALVLVALWWSAWTACWWRWVARGRGRSLSLVAYELALVPLVLTAVVTALMGWIDATLAEPSWQPWNVLLASVACGGVTWTVLTRQRAVPRVRSWTRRLWVGIAMNSWSAVGEELAFRLLLLAGLAAWWHSAWLAWIAVTVLFGLHHYPVGGLRAARLHVGTGAVFGALMLLGGGIWAAICAHLIYNVLAAIAREAEMQNRPHPARRLGLRRVPYPH